MLQDIVNILYEILPEASKSLVKLNFICKKLGMSQDQIDCLYRVYFKYNREVSEEAIALYDMREMSKYYIPSDTEKEFVKVYITPKTMEGRLLYGMIDISVDAKIDYDDEESANLPILNGYWITERVSGTSEYTNEIEFYADEGLVDRAMLKQSEWRFIEPFLVFFTQEDRVRHILQGLRIKRVL